MTALGVALLEAEELELLLKEVEDVDHFGFGSGNKLGVKNAGSN